MSKICPLMSRVADGCESQSDLVEVDCRQIKCALWIIERDEDKISIERCGLIK